MDTPLVSAVGRNRQAAELRRAALRYGIPVVEDDELAGKLSGVAVDQEIPEELYRPVAELLIGLDE